jgi:hypothetical protein
MVQRHEGEVIKIRCRAGDIVEVRSAQEILATLDQDGCLDRFPFMPEMLRFCGRQYRVFRSAHKTCDSVYYKDGRIMDDAVFLEDLRCDGSGHGGCQANCLLFFKLAWLKPVTPDRDWKLPAAPLPVPMRDEAWLRSTAESKDAEGQAVYRCQATEHLRATRTFKPFDLQPLIADLRSRNATFGELSKSLLLLIVWHLRVNVKLGWRFWTWLYTSLHRWIHGNRMDPHVGGAIPLGQPTPEVATNLQEGEWVRVRSLDEISATLNVASRNRGLSFNSEMAVFSGGTYRVEKRVTTIVDEKTGRMTHIHRPCIMLEGVRCLARYHPETLLCPKRLPQYFREAWLERVPDSESGPDR